MSAALYTPENARAINYLRLVALLAADPKNSRAAIRRREALRLAKILDRNLEADLSKIMELRAWGAGFLPERTVARQFETSQYWQAPQARQPRCTADV